VKVTRWVSFQGEYGDFVPPDSDGELDGTGIPVVARFVAKGLRDAGVAADEPADRGGWAYDFGGQFEGHPFEVVVGSTDELRPWVLCVELRPRKTAWLPWRQPDLAPVLARLCERLHAVIADEPRAREIRWYAQEAWDRDPDHAWTAHP
jgi:hypothetical protein